MTVPWIGKCVAAERLALHGASFDRADGHLLRLDPAMHDFVCMEG